MSRGRFPAVYLAQRGVQPVPATLKVWAVRGRGSNTAGRSTMFERILVPIDASGESLLALPLACQLAEATGARLRLLRVALAYACTTVGSPAPSGSTIPHITEG